MHKKPKGYVASIPFVVAMHGVHRMACREVRKTHNVNWVEMEYLICTQYALQVSARDMLGVSAICRTVGRGFTTSKTRKVQKYLDQLKEKGCTQMKSLGKKGTLYGLTPLGAEVVRFYQRQLYRQLELAEYYEKTQIQFKYFTLDQLPASALDKGVGR